MDEKLLYILLGLAYLAFQYFGSLKKQQREAEKKHPPPPRREAPPVFEQEQQPPATETRPIVTLEDILRDAEAEARKADEQRRKIKERTAELKRKEEKLNQQARLIRQAPAPLLTVEDEVHKKPRVEPVVTTATGSVKPVFDLRQAMIHHIILQRPEY